MRHGYIWEQKYEFFLPQQFQLVYRFTAQQIMKFYNFSIWWITVIPDFIQQLYIKIYESVKTALVSTSGVINCKLTENEK